MPFGDRKRPMRRDTPGARKFAEQRHELTSDPETRRAFEQRGRESGSKVLRESARKGAVAERRKRATEGPLTPREWREHAFESSEGRCIVSGARADHVYDRRFHVHHPLPKDELRRREVRAHVWDPRNAVWLLATVHLAGENGRPLARSILGPGVWEFCAEMDGLGTQGDGPEWATALVERLHPAGSIE